MDAGLVLMTLDMWMEIDAHDIEDTDEDDANGDVETTCRPYLRGLMCCRFDDNGNVGRNDNTDNDDDDVEEYLQALFVWSPSLGSTKYSTLFFFNNFCRSAGSLSLRSG